jgi:glycosyltransferase involved in cell wall biosynthesis
MKILIIQDFLRSGGTERQSILLANAFAAAGHSTTLLTFRPGGALAGTVGPEVTRVALQPVDLRLDWFAPGLGAAVSRAQPDVALCMGRMANCHAGRMQRQYGRAAVVATMRTGKPLPWLFRLSLPRVRHIVANSLEARATLHERYGVPLDRVSCIYNALVFPPDVHASRNDALRRQHGAGPQTTVLLCVAMFRPEKNQRELVEIVAGLPSGADWQLWLAGDGPARRTCETLARNRQVADRVKFLGFQPDPSALYPAADIAVHASWSEALSNFLIEAQACGLPGIACAAQGIAECFSRGGPVATGWVIRRGDHAAFRAAVERLMRDTPAERAARRHAASAFARTTFDPSRQVAGYLSLFHSLTAHRP